MSRAGNPKGKRVGLLGGAFNPPHLGHLKLAELALHHLSLDEVRFVPTARSPHKETAEGSPTPDARMRLLQAFLETVSRPFLADFLELERGGTSYTADTLETLCSREPETQWILLLGSDQLPGLPAWYRVERVLELASLAVAPRPGFSLELVPEFMDRVRPGWSGDPGELIWLPGTELALASSTLRESLRQGDSPGGLSPQVEAAIRRENYYR
jgi:nicotinate-nucleotide adenylyltransferase